MERVTIAGREVSSEAPPLVVAEMSGNHNHSLEQALAIVEAAAAAGAHALKLQTYTPDTITLDAALDEFVVRDPGSPWAGRTLYDLYAEAMTPWEWHEPIFARARDLGMIAFSTPFDDTAVEFLEQLGAPCHKIASFELVHLPLIRACAATGKPLILSTGMASAEEIEEAVEAARGAGCGQIVLLKCTSTYPADPAESDLLTIPDMRERFGCEVGLSDHTLGPGTAVAAVALGAVLVEKHLTISRAAGGVDASFSTEPAEFSELVTGIEVAWASLGKVAYGPTPGEEASLRFRRSLRAVADIARGEVLNEENVGVIRPAGGLAPRHLDEVIGRRAARDIARGSGISWDQLD